MVPISTVREDAVARLRALPASDCAPECEADTHLLSAVLATGTLPAVSSAQEVFAHLCRHLAQVSADQDSSLHRVAMPYSVALLAGTLIHGHLLSCID